VRCLGRGRRESQEKLYKTNKMDVKDLKTYKDSCYSALSRDLTEFEKNFLLISGAILAFSITFITDIVKVQEAEYLGFLFLGWTLIIVAIAIMMHTFLSAAKASDDLWKTADDFIEENCFYENEKKLTDEECKAIKQKINSILYPSKKSLRNSRKMAVNIFIGGVTSFAFFVSINIFKDNSRSGINAKIIEKPFRIDTVGCVQAISATVDFIKYSSLADL
jgi:hypothetical protein